MKESAAVPSDLGMQRRLRLLLWAQGAAPALDHLEHEDIEECEIYWQGGEAMIMGPAWL